MRVDVFGVSLRCFLYGSCYSVIESSTSVTFRRLFSLTLGLFFGYCAVDIYILERKRSGRDLPKRKRKKPRRFMGQSVFARLGFGKRWRSQGKVKMKKTALSALNISTYAFVILGLIRS